MHYQKLNNWLVAIRWCQENKVGYYSKASVTFNFFIETIIFHCTSICSNIVLAGDRKVGKFDNYL